MKNLLRRVVATMLVASIGGLGFPTYSQARTISTEAAVAGSDRERISRYLDRDDVATQLEAFGVNAADVSQRVAALTDEEAAKLAGEMDSLPAGGVVGLVLTVFLVLLITDILGLTKVFPFTRSVR